MTASQEGETPASEPPADSTNSDDSPSETSGEDAASSHLLSEEAVSSAAQATGVSVAVLRDVLATVAASVDVDDRRVVVVPDRVWSDLQARLDVEADVLDAVRFAHTRIAETLVVEAGTSDYRRFSQEYSAFVGSL